MNFVANRLQHGALHFRIAGEEVAERASGFPSAFLGSATSESLHLLFRLDALGFVP